MTSRSVRWRFARFGGRAVRKAGALGNSALHGSQRRSTCAHRWRRSECCPTIFTRMKAIRVHETGGPEVLRLEDIDAPTPGAGRAADRRRSDRRQLHRDLSARGTVSGSSTLHAGRRSGRRRSRSRHRRHRVRGRRRVVSQAVKGAYAAQAIVAAERAVRIPDGVSTKQAAAVFLQGLTAHYLAVSTFPLAKGHRALVHAAAGGVGLLLCQIAKRRGAFVIGTASTPEKRQLALDAGADEVIDYTTQDFAAETRRLTGGAGVHVVYDSVGRTTFDKSLDCLAPRGLMALFGQSSGPVPPLDPQILNRKGSLFLTRPTLQRPTSRRAPSSSSARTSCSAGLANGTLERANRRGVSAGERGRRTSRAGRRARRLARSSGSVAVIASAGQDDENHLPPARCIAYNFYRRPDAADVRDGSGSEATMRIVSSFARARIASCVARRRRGRPTSRRDSFASRRKTPPARRSPARSWSSPKDCTASSRAGVTDSLGRGLVPARR